MPPVNSGVQLTEEEIKAKTLLKDKLRFADEDTLHKEMQSLEQRLTLNTRHDRLESMFDGDDGRPRYDRREVEDFMRRNGNIFDPEVAYREMYRDELRDWDIKQATSGKKSRPYSVPPTSPGKGEDGAITREKIREMEAKGKAVFLPWYRKHMDQINALMADGKL